MLNMQGIGKQKIKYKDHSSVEFDTLTAYITLAKKSVSKFANQFYSGLSIQMLKDEDALSSIANAIMMADWRWDENYSNTKGTKKSKYSYRNQCAIWAIQTYVTKYAKNKQKDNTLSLDHIIDKDNSVTSGVLMADQKTISPLDILIKKESSDHLRKNIDNILSIDFLSERQKDYIKLYYLEGLTFDKIGKKYNITREAVRQGLNKALEVLRKINND